MALTERAIPVGHDIIIGIIGRYEEFLATLPSELHGECARQIARRFAVGCGAREIYHGEGGLFAALLAMLAPGTGAIDLPASIQTGLPQTFQALQPRVDALVALRKEQS